MSGALVLSVDDVRDEIIGTSDCWELDKVVSKEFFFLLLLVYFLKTGASSA
jgi:hypothetical protein